MLRIIWELFKDLFTRKPKEDDVPTCIISSYDLRHPTVMEEKLLDNGFDLNGWVEITEVQPNILWIYAQKKEKSVSEEIAVRTRAV